MLHTGPQKEYEPTPAEPIEVVIRYEDSMREDDTELLIEKLNSCMQAAKVHDELSQRAESELQIRIKVENAPDNLLTEIADAIAKEMSARYKLNANCYSIAFD